ITLHAGVASVRISASRVSRLCGQTVHTASGIDCYGAHGPVRLALARRAYLGSPDSGSYALFRCLDGRWVLYHGRIEIPAHRSLAGAHRYPGRPAAMNARAGDTARAASLLGISARYLATLCLGAGLGALVLFVATLEARWLVYVGGGLAFLTVVLMARNKEQLLWFALVLALQVDVSFRLLYGHAGAEGLTFPLPIVVGMVLFLWYAL